MAVYYSGESVQPLISPVVVITVVHYRPCGS